MDAISIYSDLEAVTKKWTKQRKAEIRRANAASRRDAVFSAPRLTTIRDEAWKVMEASYLKASDNGALPAHARQIFYAAREPIQNRTGESLSSTYFTQTLLPDFISENPALTAHWDVVFDARGHFQEPHTGRNVPLGTLEVRQYLQGPSGPTNRFGAVLFIEKEGFLPLFRHVLLAERYDLAIMSTKGMSVVASRKLVDELCGRHGIPLLVLHDFDLAGFSILGTISRSNRRYEFKHRVQVIDLGLRLQDAEKHDLPDEEFFQKITERKARARLHHNGATQEEMDFILGKRRRVELNAFDSRALVNWVEGKLKKCGVKKVLPDAKTLDQSYEQAFVNQFVRAGIPDLEERAKGQLAVVGIPDKLKSLVASAFKKDKEKPWDEVVNQIAKKRVSEFGGI